MGILSIVIGAIGGIVIVYASVFADVHRLVALWLNYLGVCLIAIAPFLYLHGRYVEKEQEPPPPSPQAMEKLLKTQGDIAQRLAHRADLLADEAAERFIEKLKSLPPNSVWLVRTEDSREASEFSGVLEDALKKAGCLAGVSTLVNVRLSPNPPGRIVVHARDESQRKNAALLAAALADVGIPDVRTSTAPPPIGVPAPLMIVIKAK